MSAERTRSILRGTATIIVVAALYEVTARSGMFPRALMPTLAKVASTFADMVADGSMLHHAATTLARMLAGFALAVIVGLPLGILMGRSRRVEGFFLPLTSALWFGLGNAVTVLIVLYAALFPMMLSAWSGMRSVNRLWLRAAGAMGADEQAMFWKVILPGASPFIITGLRQAFLRAWIAVVGAEMLAASDWGLGWVIYDSREFLNVDVMLASVAVIGIIGFAFERLVFGSLERFTVQRWGMVQVAKG
jgi:NitT/TauT family transport system permease protein